MPAAKPKRPEIDYIVIHFKDHIPVVVDPQKVNCLVWGEEGPGILEDFYTYRYEKGTDPEGKKKAEEAKKCWKGKGKTKARIAGTGDEEFDAPAMLFKTTMCTPDGIP